MSERNDLINLAEEHEDMFDRMMADQGVTTSRADWKARALAAEAKISRLEAEVEAGWQPIETAPRDGTSILVAILFEGTYFQAVVFWDGAWVDESQGTSYPEPTHWRPQPAPPRTEGERA